MTRQTPPATVSRDILSGIAICMLIFVSTLYLPVLGFFMTCVLPQPVLFYRLKLGRNLGLVIPLAVVILIGILIQGLTVDIFFCFALLMTGYVLGEFLETRMSMEKTIAYTVASTLGICLALLIIYTVTTGQNLLTLVSDYVVKNLEFSLQLYSEMGLSEEKIGLISSKLELIGYYLTRLLPALLTVMLTVIAWLNTLLIKKILKKKGITFSWLGILNRWKTYDHLVWFVILFSLITLIPHRGAALLGWNFLLVLMLVYFFQGMAVLAFYFEKKGFPAVLRFFFYSLIVIQQVLIILVIGLGFFDTWLNFRKLEKE
ncbi:MAG: YybS family protein [Desulfobacteraceae bacterium]